MGKEMVKCLSAVATPAYLPLRLCSEAAYLPPCNCVMKRHANPLAACVDSGENKMYTMGRFQKMCQVNGKDKTAKRNYHAPNLDRRLQMVETLPSFPHGLFCRGRSASPRRRTSCRRRTSRSGHRLSSSPLMR